MRTLGFAVWITFALQETSLFEEKFAGNLSAGWTWLREDPAAWKIESGALRIKALPGKIWYKTKSAKNVLLRKSPAAGTAEAPISFEVTVESAPETSAEQCGLYLYFDEKNFVKIIRENVNGKTSILVVRELRGIPDPSMAKEEPAPSVRLRLTWSGPKVAGAYKVAGEWIAIGETDTPPSEAGASVGLTCHGAAPEADRWAKFTDLRIVKSPK
jgi:regulation of enolase protein 1 (concanavalin A-like superfamily)